MNRQILITLLLSIFVALLGVGIIIPMMLITGYRESIIWPVPGHMRLLRANSMNTAP